MQMTRLKKSLSFIVCIVLIAVIALFTIVWNGNSHVDDTTTNISYADGSILGQGDTQFNLTVVDGDGKETSFQINTDEKTVGGALVKLNLISGEVGQYGLYVKTVNGVTVDYDKDGKYWAFYIDGQYAQTGVEATEITAGAAYAFKVE